MLFSSGTLGRFSTILTGTLANPSMYCSGHNNLPPLRLPREGKLIIPETFKLFPDISLRCHEALSVAFLDQGVQFLQVVLAERQDALIRTVGELISEPPVAAAPGAEEEVGAGPP